MSVALVFAIKMNIYASHLGDINMLIYKYYICMAVICSGVCVCMYYTVGMHQIASIIVYVACEAKYYGMQHLRGLST